MIYGVDVSNHQEQFDFTGWDFAFIKSSEGTGFKDGRFTQHVANARVAGCLVAAYHYVRGGDVQGQFDNIRSMVPTDIPVILDVEDGAGSVDSIKQLAAKLRAAGYAVPLTYFPRWYWNSIGQPDLSGLAPLWLSWYPDYKPRPREQAYAMVPGSGKQPFGGIDSAPVIQFTSTPFDQNAFDGTRDQLAALLGSRQEEEDVSADDVWNHQIDLNPKPEDKDQSPTAPAGRVLELTNDAAWGAKDGVDALREEFTEFKDTVLATLGDIASAVRAFQSGAQISDDQLAAALTRTGALADVVRTSTPIVVTNLHPQSGSTNPDGSL